MSLSYPTDLTDDQGFLVAPLLPEVKSGGRPRSTNLRHVLNAILCVLMGGIAWRLLPHDFPKWQTVDLLQKVEKEVKREEFQRKNKEQMPTYEQLKSPTAEECRRACGVKLQTFNRMVAILTEAKARQQPGRPSTLSVENQLLLTLEYLREYRTYFHIAQSWGLHESTICRIVRKTEDMLMTAKEFHLPGKSFCTVQSREG